jgi:hypothetical protein
MDVSAQYKAVILLSPRTTIFDPVVIAPDGVLKYPA